MNNLATTIIPCPASAVTMSSLEVVAYINASRKPGKPKLRHDHFMVKVSKVLGASLTPKFAAVGYFINGAGHKVPRNIYNFPKREACLLAMSYSYELQAKVLDRMIALDAALKAAQAPRITGDFATALRLAAMKQEVLETARLQIAAAVPNAE